MRQAVTSARSTGLGGVVMPSVEELELEDPEIVRQGGRYGVDAGQCPSIHMLRADVSTTVSPIVGNEKQSQDMVNDLYRSSRGSRGSCGSPTSLAAASTRSWGRICRRS